MKGLLLLEEHPQGDEDQDDGKDPFKRSRGAQFNQPRPYLRPDDPPQTEEDGEFVIHVVQLAVD